MPCVVISSPHGKKAWSVHRTTELIAYHRADRRVRILLAILAMNKLREGSNTLRIMHRGNVQGRLEVPWPLPHHPDERRTDGPSLLEEIYGRAFEESAGRILRRSSLAPWESWYAVPNPDVVRAWPPAASAADVPSGDWLRQVGVRVDRSEYAPFTNWEVGPFQATGLYLIAISLAFCGETYSRLVQNGGPFTVDGPRRLISRIVHGDLSSVSAVDRDSILESLADFANPATRLTSSCYDLVILGPPAADCDEVCVREDQCAIGIYAAPRQPGRLGVRRLLARDQCFTLSLSYAESGARHQATVRPTSSVAS